MAKRVTNDPRLWRRLLMLGLMGLATRSPELGAEVVKGGLERYNLTWDIPSKDSSGSMPIGNGDISLNLWAEENGDLLFYVGKTDSWSENGSLLKLGRIRIHLSPNPFGKGVPFQQKLKLRESEIEILAGKKDSEMQLKVWVDANQPVIRVEAECKQDFNVQASLEVWRQKERELVFTRDSSEYMVDSLEKDGPPVVYPDTILGRQRNRVVWYHRNEKSIWPVTLRLQGLESFLGKARDPLLGRTFGGAIHSEDLVSEDTMTLKSAKPGKRYVISICLLTKQTASFEEWLQELDHNIEQIEKVPLRQALEAHRRWWDEFWDRSWIWVSGAKDAEMVNRGYVLQRFINACGGRGAYPIKFNGSIFTVDVTPRKVPEVPATTTHELAEAKRRSMTAGDPDYRRWGGAYWFQNTRLMYWPMLASGDFDLMLPFFKMYFDTLPLAKDRTQIYFGHSGVFFPETMYFWGTYLNLNYGWTREGRPASFVDNPYIRYHWEGGLELTTMMMDYYLHTQDQVFLNSVLLPVAQGILEFYERHYPREAQGRIHFEPAQSLETYQTAVNPLPEIAGLKFILGKLLSLPEGDTSEAQRRNWQSLLGELPSLPTRQLDGETILAPAQRFAHLRNVENPELYAVFPFRLYGVGKPGLEMGQLTFKMRQFIVLDDGMTQDPVQAAFLGLAGEARDYTVHYFRNRDYESRFPAFWAAGGDWIPNQCLGGNATMALQTMLLQSEDKAILLFPAWPKAWDVEFRLHAPYNTTLEGGYKKGKLEQLKVVPESRTRDVVRLEPQ